MTNEVWIRVLTLNSSSNDFGSFPKFTLNQSTLFTGFGGWPIISAMVYKSYTFIMIMRFIFYFLSNTLEIF